MNSSADKLRNRITVMLGSSHADRTTLEILDLLTTETPAEVLGLFREDTELLALAELPVVREYCQLTHAERRLEAADLERRLRIQARSAEQALAGIAGRSGLEWSFRTVRGSLAGLLADAIQEMDLLLLSAARSTRPLAGRPAAATLPGPHTRPVAVTFDGSEATRRALAVASRMAGAGKQPLTILLLATDPDALVRLRTQALELTGPTPAEFRELVNPGLEDILTAVRNRRAGVVVLGLSPLLAPPASLETLCSRLRCPAVLVR